MNQTLLRRERHHARTVLAALEVQLARLHPQAALVSGPDGALYGTTCEGGSSGAGTIFRVHNDGTGFQVLRDFQTNNVDGQKPYAALILAQNGMLYGTTYAGGTNNLGTVFRLGIDGANYLILHNFTTNAADGRNPYAALVQGTDGVLYGTTYAGGNGIYLSGTVFRLNSDGTGYTILRNFTGGPTDGANPRDGVVQGSGGALYGTTYAGGSANQGTLFRLNADGTGYSR